MNVALSWHTPRYVPSLRGALLLRDGAPSPDPVFAITRAILRVNAQVSPVDALMLAGLTVRAARRNGLPPEFLAATLLQESAYDPRALSSAGAVGIAQFELSTASALGVDPFDPKDAVEGAATLLASYVRAYDSYPVPFVEALAAYNAGPGAVDAYRGLPPYPETRAYVGDVFDRWAKIVASETPIRRR